MSNQIHNFIKNGGFGEYEFSKSLPVCELDNEYRWSKLGPCIDIQSIRIIYPKHRLMTLRLFYFKFRI